MDGGQIFELADMIFNSKFFYEVMLILEGVASVSAL